MRSWDVNNFSSKISQYHQKTFLFVNIKFLTNLFDRKQSIEANSNLKNIALFHFFEFRLKLCFWLKTLVGNFI